ncbi:lytic transglycosylase domain-containing protein [Salmonella enterica]|nr:lytic transglycosylase domain-containing protein [Salmonella enterica]
MSDDSAVEKFVLQYEVDSKDAQKRLEDMSSKLDSLMDKGKKSSGEIKTGFKSIGGELKNTMGELSPVADGLASSIGNIGSRLAGLANPATVAVVAISAIAVAMKKAADAYNEYYQQQKLVGFQTGMSAISVEQHQRNFSAASGLRANETQGMLGKVSNLVSGAYTNIDPFSKEAMLLRAAGVGSARTASGGRISTNAAIDQMAAKFQSVSKAQAQAIGANIGLTEREIDALRARTVAITQANKMTDEEIARRYRANQAAEQLTAANNRMDAAWDQIKTTIGAEVIPVIADFTEGLADLVQKAPVAFEGFMNAFDLWMAKMNGYQEFLLNITGAGPLSIKKTWELGVDYFIDKQITAEKSRQESDKRKADADQKTKEQAKAAQDQMTLNMNLFGSSVDVFAKATDETNDPAYENAWAGSVGEAAGLPGLGSNPRFANSQAIAPAGGIGGYTPGGGKPTNNAYDALYAKYWGSDAAMGKAIMMAESGGVNRRTSEKGAQGLNQLLPKYWSDGGTLDLMDPETNIKQAKKAYDWARSQAAKSGLTGDALTDETLRWYNGGGNRGSRENVQYPGRVRQYLPTVGDATKGFNVAVIGRQPEGAQQTAANDSERSEMIKRMGIHGNTRQDYYAMKGEEQLAASMGVPVAQLRRGDIPAIDTGIASRQMLFNAAQEKLKAEQRWATMSNMTVDANDPQAGRLNAMKGQAQQQLLKANRDFMIAERGAAPYAEGNKGTNEARTFTFNQTFNIAGAGKDADKIASAVINQAKQHFNDSVKDSNNSSASGVSH